jgi:hypothetical protein
MKKISLILLIPILFTGYLLAQTPMGSKSMVHVQTARTFEAGRFEIHSDLNFFTKLAENLGNLSPDQFDAANYWLVNSGLALTYGISDNFDIIVAPGIYQDTHTSNEFNLPDDIRLYIKAASFDFAERHMYYGFQAGFRFPVGEDHNYPFTYYASPAVEYGISTALSYYADPYLPDRSLSFHLNAGWWNHNEAGEILYGKQKATVNSSELLYGFGILYPIDLFDFQLELTGSTFLEQPDEFVYSREDWMYVTPSIKYKPFSWFKFIFGVDIRVSGDEQTSTVGAGLVRDLGLPNYSAWKAHLGFELTILPLGNSGQSAAQIDKEQFNKRVEFFQQIIEDRERSENIKEELDKLKEERESAEKELEELKQILEEEGN